MIRSLNGRKNTVVFISHNLHVKIGNTEAR